MGQSKRAAHSDKAEMQRIRQIARSLGLRFDKVVKSGSEANFVAIRSRDLLFSHRIDSRTYFVHDKRYGVRRETQVFDGTPAVQRRFGRIIFKRLGIPLTEIGEEHVITERSQVAHLEKETRNISVEDVQKGRSFVRFSRQIQGVPIWSSHLILGLTHGKEIGFMELHWPVIPDHLLAEARRLAYQVKHGWRAPEVQGATAESVEAGVVHSPSAAFIMDIYPAIRVIYAPLDRRYGRKPMYHFDRHGKPVPTPRVAELPKKPVQRRQPVAGQA